MSKEESDEITIDFSAIKKWFTGKSKIEEETKHSISSKHSIPSTESASSPSTESGPTPTFAAGHHPPSHASLHHPPSGMHADASVHPLSDDNEITLDLKKLVSPFTKFFGSGKSPPSASTAGSSPNHPSPTATAQKDEGIAVSWPGVKKFFITWHLLLLLLIPLYIAYDIRMQTRELPITQEWARDTIYNNIRGTIQSQVVKSYPNLPEAQRNDVVNEQFNKVIAEQKDQLETQIKNQAAYFKSRFNDEHGHTMLLDIDSYSYFRETRNLLTFDHNGNSLVNGTNWDTYIMAPMGVPAGKNLHNYLGVWEFKIWKMFDKDIYLMKSFFYLPMIVYVLAIIPAYMIGTYYGGWFGGVVTGVMLAIHPAVLTRTMAGVTDTDVYQIFFPLLVVWIFFEAFKRKSPAWKYSIASLSGAALGLYSLAWSGWWLIFYFIIAISLLHMASHVYYETNKGKVNLSASWRRNSHVFYMMLLFILFTGVVTTILRDFRFFLGFYTEPFAFLALKKASNPNLWPNVYTTVAELNPISIQGAISQISFGSILLFGLACLGILLAFTKRDSTGHIDVKLPALLAMWFVSTLWASKSGVRFVGLTVPAFSLAIGACFGILATEGSGWLKRHLRIPEIASKIVLILLLSLLLINPVKAGYATARHNIPLISDAWWQSLSEIREKSQPNAILTSWWDFGHWFKAVADRPSTFDGGTQNTPIAHWVGKILLTADEEQAIGILRMLDCGSFQSVPELEAQGFSTLDAIHLVYSTLNKTRQEAREAYVLAGVKNPDSYLHYTHCTPPQGFFITSADMVGKSGVWAHFGSWDFRRSNIWVDRNNGTFEDRVMDIQKDFNFTQDESENLQREVLAIRDEGEANGWIAPWPSFGGGSACTKQTEIVACQNGLIVNLTTMNIVYTGETAPIHGLVFVQGDDVVQKTYPKYAQDISIGLVPSGDNFNAVFMQYPLGLSMFTRLYYFEGHGLHHFKRFSDKTSVLGERIIVWNVDWDGKEKNIYYHINQTVRSPATPPPPTKPQKNISFPKPASKPIASLKTPANPLPLGKAPSNASSTPTINQTGNATTTPSSLNSS